MESAVNRWKLLLVDVMPAPKVSAETLVALSLETAILPVPAASFVTRGHSETSQISGVRFS